ncbi:hypothetical protein [Bremerella sp. P1]|uniref:hypothetical protein n=1 Tax=Bremerella sp. P1 TaxID=3026424 RepID=UPI00236751C0|nr:hypothetical protein [Bremerella sp. P1]WDI43252.1 hypothetical protein PSR63_04745 [Bremerella sp. P1]
MKANVLGSLLCAAVMFVLLAGCTAESKTFTGSVTLDGNPLDSAGVKLVSKDSSARGEHFSTTDAAGKFTIQEDPNNPLSPGDYIVVVDKVPQEMGGKSVVPNQYRSTETTPITLTIAPESSEIPPITISSN